MIGDPCRLLAEEGTLRALYEYGFLLELEDRKSLRRTGWLYAGDGADVYDPDRDITADMCLACGGFRTEDLHDPCIANLPGVYFACCGHGRSGRWVNVNDLHGPVAARRMRELGGNPPPQAFVLDPIDGARAESAS
jgi:hypothetical protein